MLSFAFFAKYETAFFNEMKTYVKSVGNNFMLGRVSNLVTESLMAFLHMKDTDTQKASRA
jgi:hypothetical protein